MSNQLTEGIIGGLCKTTPVQHIIGTHQTEDQPKV